MAKSAAKRMERLEGICIGAGFLLEKLYVRYRNELGDGMREQIRQCLHDTKQVGEAVLRREQKAKEPGHE